MAIACNEISQVAAELKMKFKACFVLEAADMDRLVELIETVNSCDDTFFIAYTNTILEQTGTVELNTNIETQYWTLTDNTTIGSVLLPSVGFSKRISLIVNSQNLTETLTIPVVWNKTGTYHPTKVNKLNIEVSNTSNGVFVDCEILTFD